MILIGIGNVWEKGENVYFGPARKTKNLGSNLFSALTSRVAEQTKKGGVWALGPHPPFTPIKVSPFHRRFAPRKRGLKLKNSDTGFKMKSKMPPHETPCRGNKFWQPSLSQLAWKSGVSRPCPKDKGCESEGLFINNNLPLPSPFFPPSPPLSLSFFLFFPSFPPFPFFFNVPSLINIPFPCWYSLSAEGGQPGSRGGAPAADGEFVFSDLKRWIWRQNQKNWKNKGNYLIFPLFFLNFPPYQGKILKNKLKF